MYTGAALDQNPKEQERGDSAKRYTIGHDNCTAECKKTKYDELFLSFNCAT
jgi:hypothetical protein